MIRRDYLLRLIEQAIRLLQAAFGLVDLRRYPEALAMLSEGYRQLFGMDSDTLVRLPLPFLKEQIGNDSEGTALMASLLEAEGDVLKLMDNEEAALVRWERAITLLLDAVASGWFVAPPGLPTTVDTLAHRLHGYTLPAAMTASLFRHYAAADFPRAENYLWEWEDESGVKSAAGVAFYESLRKLDDAALAVGGFTRAEVEKGYADFVASTQQA